MIKTIDVYSVMLTGLSEKQKQGLRNALGVDYRSSVSKSDSEDQLEFEFVTYIKDYNYMKNYINNFKTKAAAKEVTRGDMLMRCVMKALRSKQNDKLALAQALVNEAFTRPTNEVKLENGAGVWWGFHHAKWEAASILRNMTDFLLEEETPIVKDIIRGLKAPE